MMMMSPASNLHRIIVHYIFNELLDQIESANNVGSEATRIDVNYILKNTDKKYKYLEPDIFAGSDLLWKGEILVSAPELVIEVLSFATAKYDKTEKMDLYKSIGVKEYILVSQDGSVELYRLQNDNYKDYLKIDNKFKSDYLNITLDFDKIFSLVQDKFN
ncbi:Uma2 family endonuclease [Clostridium sp. NSJ-6]|uniref:Uma2 family endonuclease n=1 Tax=Clostridium hominis TaxID=2763036 RepID=A0ABR7DB87_9CLOT|nr:Uma2 family endonuclease [Clostridium hominis]MBC5628143.1 Uma2 family endonuclease [Clostridium hominis]MDU2673100.1 Uma2 family endonuclease [Clostridium sp.]